MMKLQKRMMKLQKKMMKLLKRMMRLLNHMHLLPGKHVQYPHLQKHVEWVTTLILMGTACPM